MNRRWVRILLVILLVAAALPFTVFRVEARKWLLGDERVWSAGRVCRDGAEIFAVDSNTSDPTFGVNARTISFSATNFTGRPGQLDPDNNNAFLDPFTEANYGPIIATSKTMTIRHFVDPLGVDRFETGELSKYYAHVVGTLLWNEPLEPQTTTVLIAQEAGRGLPAEVEDCYLYQIPDPDRTITLASDRLNAGGGILDPEKIVYRVMSLPTKGDLRVEGRLLAVGSFFTQAEVNAGSLTYSWHGAALESDSFDFIVRGTDRASVTAEGNQVDLASGSPDLSAEGRTAAFRFDDPDLIPSGRIVVQHRSEAGLIVDQASSDPWAGPADGEPDRPAVSEDGRYVAFQSEATNLVPGGDDLAVDIFVFDGLTKKIVQVSVASDGTPGDWHSTDPTISADGRFVAFASVAQNLVEGKTTIGVADIYVHDRDADEDGVFDEPGEIETTRVSVTSSGEEADGASAAPDLSGDGRFVAFDSAATNLGGETTTGVKDVFVHDRETGATTLVSANADDQSGDGNSYDASISADGRFIAFTSDAANLVADEPNGVADIYLSDRGEGEGSPAVIERVSLPMEGATEDSRANAGHASVSADGGLVAFEMQMDTEEGLDPQTSYVFVRDRAAGVTRNVSASSEGRRAGDHSFSPAISADGKFVLFQSLADNLIVGDTNLQPDIFLQWIGVPQTLSLEPVIEDPQGTPEPPGVGYYYLMPIVVR